MFRHAKFFHLSAQRDKKTAAPSRRIQRRGNQKLVFRHIRTQAFAERSNDGFFACRGLYTPQNRLINRAKKTEYLQKNFYQSSKTRERYFTEIPNRFPHANQPYFAVVCPRVLRYLQNTKFKPLKKTDYEKFKCLFRPPLLCKTAKTIKINSPSLYFPAWSCFPLLFFYATGRILHLIGQSVVLVINRILLALYPAQFNLASGIIVQSDKSYFTKRIMSVSALFLWFLGSLPLCERLSSAMSPLSSTSVEAGSIKAISHGAPA